MATSDEARLLYRHLAHERGLHLSDQEADVVAAFLRDHDYAGRPRELVRLHGTGQLTGDLPTYLVAETWRYRLDDCDVPLSAWRELFLTARYTKDLAVAGRPRWPLRLYRGATYPNRLGRSWTTELDQAFYFARFRQAPGTTATIWTVTAPPDRLFAYLGGFEHEHVVDVHELPIRPVDPTARRTRITARLPTLRPFVARPPRGGGDDGYRRGLTDGL